MVYCYFVSPMTRLALLALQVSSSSSRWLGWWWLMRVCRDDEWLCDLTTVLHAVPACDGFHWQAAVTGPKQLKWQTWQWRLQLLADHCTPVCVTWSPITQSLPHYHLPATNQSCNGMRLAWPRPSRQLKSLQQFVSLLCIHGDLCFMYGILQGGDDIMLLRCN